MKQLVVFFGIFLVLLCTTGLLMAQENSFPHVDSRAGIGTGKLPTDYGHGYHGNRLNSFFEIRNRKPYHNAGSHLILSSGTRTGGSLLGTVTFHASEYPWSHSAWIGAITQTGEDRDKINLVLATSTTTRMVILANGNVGIGIEKPEYTLDVHGKGRYSGILKAASFEGAGTGLTGTAQALSIGGTAAKATNAIQWNGYTHDFAGAGATTVSHAIVEQGGILKKASATSLAAFLGLGANAYTSTPYLPLAGGILTGALNGTTAGFSGGIAAGTFYGAGTGLSGTAQALSIGGNATTVTHGIYTTGRYANPEWISSLSWTKITGAPAYISTETDPNIAAWARGSQKPLYSYSEIVGAVPQWNQHTTGAAATLSAVLPASLGGAGNINGLLKADGNGQVSAAVAGTDYVQPTGLQNYLPLSGGTLTGKLTGADASFSSHVGIGMAPPTDSVLLAVNGDIQTRKLIVTQIGWADYVFEPTYRLRPLSEVETFIKQNKHLPEVPSAKEVEEKGISIGDNQALLLKKIEELTLYVIEANKNIEMLKKENGEMKKMMKKK